MYNRRLSHQFTFPVPSWVPNIIATLDRNSFSTKINLFPGGKYAANRNIFEYIKAN